VFASFFQLRLTYIDASLEISCPLSGHVSANASYISPRRSIVLAPLQMLRPAAAFNHCGR